MEVPPIPDDEQARLAALHRLDLLGTEPEERFDRLTRLATRVLDVPIALLTLVDADRQWFKSNQGLGVTETPRDDSFCGHAITSPEVLEIPDSHLDARFADNPLVTGEPAIRFYAGCPIAAPDGSLVGTLCVIDDVPRRLSGAELATLQDLAAIAEQELAAHHLAVDDELTGLANRRGFRLLAAQALALCAREGLSASVSFIDIDGLKAVNDHHGHAAGDALIVAVAHALRKNLRQADVIARLGGDEFAVVLAGAVGDEPEIARRILESVSGTTVRVHDDHLPVSVSVGVANVAPDSPQELEVLLGRADAAMYQMKRTRPSR